VGSSKAANIQRRALGCPSRSLENYFLKTTERNDGKLVREGSGCVEE